MAGARIPEFESYMPSHAVVAEQHHELAASDETCHLIPPEGCGPTIAQSTPTSGGVFRGLPVTV
jgi:hypothetical protein